ncbi:hypothetical protein BWK59_06430 [Flavobacterium davisii]|uniref:Uncharacterized protein n=1 Tax=Flavobacterium davisii TaxID=2906077 RepID=A0A246GIZ8_9FLAO|nr:hypothetical protein [Flavobacterium davisii]OWP84223.1 hypothetical protein BWK59_06430 [Flavobacterium davisii]
MALTKEIWVADIKENPIPDNSFINASTDMSIHVDNNKLHLAEAGVEPAVYEDYFTGNETELPTQAITDIPSEVVLKTYSTAQTRHRKLQEVELQYDKRGSIINRHKISLAKNIGKRAAHSWAPTQANSFNKVVILANGASVIEAIIDMQAFYAGLDKTEGLHICLTPAHMASIRKENKNLYKDILNGEKLYGFTVHQYSQNPYYSSTGVKNPFGTAPIGTDKQASFTWAEDEVFRCFGDVEVFPTLGHSGLQADIISFAQRALVGSIRASNPKYGGAIL